VDAAYKLAAQVSAYRPTGTGIVPTCSVFQPEAPQCNANAAMPVITHNVAFKCIFTLVTLIISCFLLLPVLWLSGSL
jgi:hypothetical protein